MEKQDLNPNKFRTQLKTADKAARIVLESLFAQRKPVDRALSNWFRENRQCGSRDRRFISETLYALLRYWGFLRKFLPEDRRNEIEQGKIRLGRMELAALFFAALYLDYRNLPWADAIAREFELPWPKPDAAAADPLLARADALARVFGVAATFSETDLIPAWVTEKLPAEFPLSRWLDDLKRRPPMWLRTQTGDLDRLLAELTGVGLTLRRHERLPHAVAVEPGQVNLFTLEAFRRGEFEVQDLASQCIGEVAAPQKGERWLDACAGAGGKTLLLADQMERTGTVVASDIRAYKLDDLRTRVRRAGFPNIMTREWDGKPFKGKQRGKFDGVLVDAPCSCAGVWRRNPDGRWTMRPEELAETAELQFGILEAAATAVRPGGVLIYATCSLFPMENGAVVNRFLSNNPDFELESFAHPLTGITTDGMVQIHSFDGDCDSMFAARLRKKEAAADESAL